MTTWSDKLADGVQLVDHSEYRRTFPHPGDHYGVVRSDVTAQEAAIKQEGSMEIETKEIKQTPDTEHKDHEVKSGSRQSESDRKDEDREA